MNSKLPTTTTITEWIQSIESDQYFEQHATNPGMLFLRVKFQAGPYQGIHLALSNSGRINLLKQLNNLKGSELNADIYEGTCAFPKGRSWFYLYSSSLRASSWFQFSIQLTKQPQEYEAMFEMHSAKVFISLTAKALEEICSVLEDTDFAAQPLPIKLGRVPKPKAAPQSLWLWSWGKI